MAKNKAKMNEKDPQATLENQGGVREVSEKVRDVFERFPKCVMLYVTSDGNMFFEKNSAEVHAQSLKDKVVDIVERKDFE